MRQATARRNRLGDDSDMVPWHTSAHAHCRWIPSDSYDAACSLMTRAAREASLRSSIVRALNDPMFGAPFSSFAPSLNLVKASAVDAPASFTMLPPATAPTASGPCWRMRGRAADAGRAPAGAWDEGARARAVCGRCWNGSTCPSHPDRAEESRAETGRCEAPSSASDASARLSDGTAAPPGCPLKPFAPLAKGMVRAADCGRRSGPVKLGGPVCPISASCLALASAARPSHALRCMSSFVCVRRSVSSRARARASSAVFSATTRLFSAPSCPFVVRSFDICEMSPRWSNLICAASTGGRGFPIRPGASCSPTETMRCNAPGLLVLPERGSGGIEWGSDGC
mmetsp:Transcript_65214/g.154507  ORF Transcript_65214/g.154507 Transcript_65214/m.154507 type:complete len:341 (+) Transcript_65214:402-1424(+)